jgi:hypothetical protein
MKEYKKTTINSFEKYKGKNFDENWYITKISKSSSGYYMDENTKKTLFVFKKKAIDTDLQNKAVNTFLQFSKSKHSNRGEAAGYKSSTSKTLREITKTGQNEGKYVSSNISGYFDRPLREHRGKFKKQIVCRTTSFTQKNDSLWRNGLPFIKKCSNLYKKYGSMYYKNQKREYSKIHKNLKIPKTVFTTITSNYNFRTACHKDRGDFSDGLGVLVLCGKDYAGGYLGFPEFKLLIKIEPGDFLLMDTHQWHCNTEIYSKAKDSYRLSFVMYIRTDMSKCSKYKKIDNTEYYY